MSREAYIDYWATWLRRTDPTVDLDVDRDNAVVTMVRQGVRFTGMPVECTCGDEECLGWTMMTIKERVP